MTAPLYRDATAGLPSAVKGHTGLYFERFFDRYTSGWGLDKTAKGAFLEDVVRHYESARRGRHERCEALVLRQLQLTYSLGGRSRVFSCEAPFVSGTGLPHPVENGLTWHPTIGAPFLCGAAVKGVLRTWVERWDGFLDDSARAARIDRWFGTPERAGDVIFFDALPDTGGQVSVDVMTPHMGKWYESGSAIESVNREGSKAVPADWHDPVPVPFLVAYPISLVAMVAPRTPDAEPELDHVLESLGDALDWLGAGAKTAAEYGRMKGSPPGGTDIEGRAKAAAEASARDKVSGILGEVLQLVDERAGSGKPWNILFRALCVESRWQGTERLEVAGILREWMKAEGRVWYEELPQGAGAALKKNHERTLEVLRVLREDHTG